MSINLKLLHTFARVAELGSFTRAAEELGRTPSAISMQVAELEGQLTLKLLERTTRKVSPTPDGKALLSRVRLALEGINDGIEELLDAAAQRRGRIRLASAPTVAAGGLGSVLAAYQLDHPNVALSVRELISADLLQAVRNREVDFGISPYVSTATDMTFEPLLREPFFALVPAKFCESSSMPLTLDALSRLPLIVMQGMPIIALDDGKEIATTIEELLTASGKRINICCHVRQAYTQVAMAAAGLGVGIVPALALPERIPSNLQVMALTDPAIVRDLGIFRPKAELLSKAAQAFVALLRLEMNRPPVTGGEVNFDPKQEAF